MTKAKVAEAARKVALASQVRNLQAQTLQSIARTRAIETELRALVARRGSVGAERLG